MFLNGEHKKRMRSFERDTSEYDSLIYILTGNEELYQNIDKIYDGNNKKLKIKFDVNGEPDLSNLWLSSSAAALLRLGIQLFNNGSKQSVFDTFCSLDSENTNLAFEAIRRRFFWGR